MNPLLPALRPTPVALALAMALSASAFAGASDGDTALTLGQVVVSATAGGPLEARRVLTSVDILPTERIESQVVNNNWELFGQVPGVMLTQFAVGPQALGQQRPAVLRRGGKAAVDHGGGGLDLGP